MNPSGYRLEEKKEQENSRNSFGGTTVDSKSSPQSYKSTHSTRSSVLERAREYNRRIEETRRRAKSLDRAPSDASGLASSSPDSRGGQGQAGSPRSKSVGRAPQTAPRLSTHERAMASVRRESTQPLANGHHAGHRHVPPRSPPGAAAAAASAQYHQSPPPQQQQPRDPQGNSRLKASPGRLMRNHQQAQQQGEAEAVVSPELLVDALSGHEDGLLAIAEKLMEHYDGGYDVMGEAIIDAFADVQKLFQHVVEAAHMEGAAFEASRREEEMADLRRQAAAGTLSPQMLLDSADNNAVPATPTSANGPPRHDEFVDQDVKDVLTDAIHKGTALRDANQHVECLRMYEQACQSASALLPVDSDHRGRLQLSLARAESMQADRACAILRYAMDDVLRSALRAGRTPLPDPSKRADVVLNRPVASAAVHTPAAGVIQSSDEALASIIEEMKEILSAPVYKDTPLQEVSQRFWNALTDAQKNQQRHSEKLEQSLGKLKGEFLLARAEWEEKLSQAQENAESYKGKYNSLKDARRGEDYWDQARSVASAHLPSNLSLKSSSGNSQYQNRAGSVASLGSGLAVHAKKLVSSLNDLNCNSLNERTGGGGTMDRAEALDPANYRSAPIMRRGTSSSSRSSPRGRSRSSRSAAKSPASSRAYQQDYGGMTPPRMDV